MGCSSGSVWIGGIGTLWHPLPAPLQARLAALRLHHLLPLFTTGTPIKIMVVRHVLNLRFHLTDLYFCNFSLKSYYFKKKKQELERMEAPPAEGDREEGRWCGGSGGHYFFNLFVWLTCGLTYFVLIFIFLNFASSATSTPRGTRTMSN